MREGKSAFSPLAFSKILQQNLTILEALLLYLIIHQHLAQRITLEEIIDMLYLLPQQIWNDFSVAMGTDKQNLVADFQRQVQTLDSDQLLELIQEQLASSLWIKTAEKSDFIFDLTALQGFDQQKFIQLDQSFMRAVYLRNLHQEQDLCFFEPYEKHLFATLLYLQFLSASEKKIGIVRQLSDLYYPHSLSEKTLSLAKEYSRDAIYLLLAQQEKLEEKNLIQSQAYLQHFRNLFKFLADHQAFAPSSKKSSIQAIDLWAYSQREELQQHYQKFQKT